jgi:hypothetical protein
MKVTKTVANDNKLMEMFKGRKLVIATMHKKEQVLSPILERELGVNCMLPDNFNSDQWGTFSGEIERSLDPVETARLKCLKAMELTGCDLGVASEGSFGPHPSLFFIQADDEFIIFIDLKNKLEIICRELSTNTNFNGKVIQSEVELVDFTVLVKFPTHGLILKDAKDHYRHIVKGITNQAELQKAFVYIKEKFGTVYIETDMRAMFNPTRMAVIEVLTKKLIAKIQSTCPECSMPGFAITSALKGLPCSLCGSPTNATLAYISVCDHCNFTQKEEYPNDKTTEDPMYCDRCNP